MTTPRRALMVVDVQQEYFDGILQIQAPSPEETLANVVAALGTAREHDLPVVVVQHQLPEGAPVFAVGSRSWSLHPEVERLLDPSWKRATKDRGSVFAGTDVAAWLAEQGVDTVSIVGFMTNNCDLATAVGAEELGLAAEVLSDATGAIHLANELGEVAVTDVPATPRRPPGATDDAGLDAWITARVADLTQRVRVVVVAHAPTDQVAHGIASAWGTVEPDGPDRCIVRCGADSLDVVARWLLLLGVELTVVEPPELRDAFAAVAAQAARSATP